MKTISQPSSSQQENHVFSQLFQANVPHNLPVALTKLVGRQTELLAIQDLITSNRLVTLFGPGGIGKTRLALSIAYDQIPYFENGVFFVSLANIEHAGMISSIIADSLNLIFQTSANPEKLLLNYLSHKQMLLILDSVEHLLADMPLIKEILQQAPQVKLLVTSRQRVNLYGEEVYEIQGLDYSSREETDTRYNEATQLFIQRAQSVHSGFMVSKNNRRHIFQICELVQGFPLAIELAAFWVKTLSCGSIATEIANNINFLRSTWGNIPKRHRSLQSVFNRSWQLLSDAEQTVLKKLSVIQGRISREAAVNIANASLDILASLIDKSLLYRITKDNYDMHSLTRQFAEKKLREDEEEANTTRDLHSTFFMNYLRHYPLLEDSLWQKEYIQGINQEIHNIRQAWLWAATRQKEPEIRLGWEIYFNYCLVRGWYKEGLDDFTQASQRLREDIWGQESSQELFWQFQLRIGVFHGWLGHYEEAHVLLEESLAYFRESNMLDEEVKCLIRLAMFINLKGEYTEDGATKAGQLLSVALQKAKQSQSPYLKAIILHAIGEVNLSLRRYQIAGNYFRESKQIFHDAGDKLKEARANNNLGVIANFLGNYEEAMTYYEQSLAHARDIGDFRNEGIGAGNVGHIFYLLGVYKNAKQHCQHFVEVSREIGDRRLIGIALARLSDVLYALAEYKTAHETAQKALQIGEEIHTPHLQRLAFGALGQALIGLGELDAAHRVFQQALALSDDPSQNIQVMNCRARLAHVLLMQKKYKQALHHTEMISPHLSGTKPEGLTSYAPYLICYKVLLKCRDPRAGTILEVAHKQLLEDAAKIKNPEWRQSFLANVPAHRELMHIVKQRRQDLIEPLTPRELEVLSLIAQGLSNKEIAEALVISIGTVKRHITNLYKKLGVQSRTQALIEAKKHILI